MRRNALQNAVAKDRPTRPLGGSARGYQELSASTVLTATEQARGQTVCLRIGSADRESLCRRRHAHMSRAPSADHSRPRLIVALSGMRVLAICVRGKLCEALPMAIRDE